MSGAVLASSTEHHLVDAREGAGEVGAGRLDEPPALVAVQRHRDQAGERQHPSDDRAAAGVVELDDIAAAVPPLGLGVGVRCHKRADQRGQDIAQPADSAETLWPPTSRATPTATDPASVRNREARTAAARDRAGRTTRRPSPDRPSGADCRSSPILPTATSEHPAALRDIGASRQLRGRPAASARSPDCSSSWNTLANDGLSMVVKSAVAGPRHHTRREPKMRLVATIPDEGVSAGSQELLWTTRSPPFSPCRAGRVPPGTHVRHRPSVTPGLLGRLTR
jgi:hypothetical protein